MKITYDYYKSGVFEMGFVQIFFWVSKDQIFLISITNDTCTVTRLLNVYLGMLLGYGSEVDDTSFQDTNKGKMSTPLMSNHSIL